ncbi:MAG: flagellar basal body P-ring protein FlgI [Phycisphaerae bacterium]|jgi:flagellar P-ring protein precursor FlgI
MKIRLILLLILLLSSTESGQCQRIKDIVDIQGVRGNPLTGIGLVVGLANTGDSSLPSQQMLANILKDSGQVLSPSDFTGGNVALVAVTADLGPFARVGSQITVTVSSMGDAKSLQGGILLPTLLKGLDSEGLLNGQVYAVAQGAVSLAGWTAGGDKASITKNHQAVGQIPNGAIVEREEIATFVQYLADDRFITLNLRNVDFSTAEQIGKTINQVYSDSAAVIDAGTIRVKIPNEINQKDIAGFIDVITKYEVEVDVPAIVVINERTGTIVVGENVVISSVAISQGSLTVKIRERDEVSQPTTMFTENATTEVTQATDISVGEEQGVLIPVPRTVTVADLANTLNAIGATPTDLIAIFHALKKAGALQAKLEIM